jgi:hypothetical protein
LLEVVVFVEEGVAVVFLACEATALFELLVHLILIRVDGNVCGYGGRGFG